MSAKPEMIERVPADTLYVTDGELMRRIGVPTRLARMVIDSLEARGGFPEKQKLWGDRRYWPAVKAYFDAMNGVKSGDRRG